MLDAYVSNVTAKVMLPYENTMGEKQHLLMPCDESTLHQRTGVKWRLLLAEIVFELQIFEVIQEQFSKCQLKISSEAADSDPTLFHLPTTRALFFSANQGILSSPLDEMFANWVWSPSAVYNQSPVHKYSLEKS